MSSTWTGADPFRPFALIATPTPIRASAALLLALAMVLAVTPAGAKTWIVGSGADELPSVQAGIDSASAGDVVLVEPGTYYENINLRGKAIHLRSAAGPEATILDGSQGDSSVVVCESGEDNRTVIEGFTITNGKGGVRTLFNRYGAGILCEGSSPVIRGNHVVGNRAVSLPGASQSRGGGIYFGGGAIPLSSYVVEGNLIADNYASGLGGGVLAGPASIIRNNVFRNNSTGIGDGGGLLLAGSKSQVEGNLFLENFGADHGGGIYIVNPDYNGVPSAQIDISNNLFIANQALGLDGAVDCSGGGIWVHGGAHVHHNTFAFNQSGGRISPAAGGICLVDTRADMILESNVFYHNGQGGMVAWASGVRGTRGALVRRNVLFDNGPDDTYNLTPGLFVLELDGNIFENPLFCIIGPESRGELAGVSPALNQPDGIIGAVAEPGCPPYIHVTTRRTTWGAIKVLYAPSASSQPGGGGKESE